MALTTTVGHPDLRDWWKDRTTADSKFIGCVGEFGSLAEARVTLIDEQDGSVLRTWPDESEPPP